METLRFKTNVQCSGCLSKVTPLLNQALGAENWNIDVNDPQKPLTVNAPGVNAEQVSQVLGKAGFSAEVIG